MHIAIALPYAVSIRDFLHSGSLAELVNAGGYRLTIYTLNPDLPEFDQVRSLGVTVKLSDTPGSVRRPAPRHGEHTAELMAEFVDGRRGKKA